MWGQRGEVGWRGCSRGLRRCGRRVVPRAPRRGGPRCRRRVRWRDRRWRTWGGGRGGIVGVHRTVQASTIRPGGPAQTWFWPRSQPSVSRRARRSAGAQRSARGRRAAPGERRSQDPRGRLRPRAVLKRAAASVGTGSGRARGPQRPRQVARQADDAVGPVAADRALRTAGQWAAVASQAVRFISPPARSPPKGQATSSVRAGSWWIEACSPSGRPSASRRSRIRSSRTDAIQSATLAPPFRGVSAVVRARSETHPFDTVADGQGMFTLFSGAMANGGVRSVSDGRAAAERHPDNHGLLGVRGRFNGRHPDNHGLRGVRLR